MLLLRAIVSSTVKATEEMPLLSIDSARGILAGGMVLIFLDYARSLMRCEKLLLKLESPKVPTVVLRRKRKVAMSMVDMGNG